MASFPCNDLIRVARPTSSKPKIAANTTAKMVMDTASSITVNPDCVLPFSASSFLTRISIGSLLHILGIVVSHIAGHLFLKREAADLKKDRHGDLNDAGTY